MVQSREYLALGQLVHCNLFQLAEVILTMTRELSRWDQISQELADKSEWDALELCISKIDGFNLIIRSLGDNTAVSEAPADGDIVAAMTDHAVMGNSGNETEVGIC